MPALRTVLFRLHWALGLTAGLVLALMGVTGALMSYEEVITDFANRDQAVVTRREGSPLAPHELVVRIQSQLSGFRVAYLTLSVDPTASALARFDHDPATGDSHPAVYVDAFDGSVIGEVRLDSTFSTIRALHRWLLIPGNGKGWGRTITGACALSLLALLAAGLYLRWPAVHRWRTWLRPRTATPGRARWWSLHAVIGTWLLPIYLVIVLSGLTWSYAWYKNAASWLLTGGATVSRALSTAGRADERRTDAEPRPLDRAWTTLRETADGEASRFFITLPRKKMAPIRIQWWIKGDGQFEPQNDAIFDPETGNLVAAIRGADKSLGRRLSDNMLEVHRGRFFGSFVAFVFCLAALTMPAFAMTGIVLYVLRRRRPKNRAI